MIGLDYSILCTLESRVENRPDSNLGFRVDVSQATMGLLDRLQFIFRYLDGTAYVFASDSNAVFEPRNITGRDLVQIKELPEELNITLLIYLADRSLLPSMDLGFRLSELPALQGLPENFKYVFYIDAGQPFSGNPIDQSSIVALASPLFKIEKEKLSSITYKRTGEALVATDEDDILLQYDFRRNRPGLYEITLDNTGQEVKDLYADPQLFNNPPFAIVDVQVPAGAFTLQQLNIEFKERT